ncbi:S-layer homology domain-containing protein [Paenibacillus xerothermodurans]|uniref:S-layer homology domain-containing protein n=1 Tax=Paenibacillus xerothermodurans TaxID=1977292 RepID=A0A2W1NJZ5_PAEXE|nr:S-layer homology domain-containing protein [Paenibacillus xerothermodurans]PZE19373.1 S-layer homology domain-containing protein [Paenibacillus xerothermodurans]
MSESSDNLTKQHSQNPKDIQGGDKKVMKKSLSTILSLAMAFSMFSSVAMAADAPKTSADFTDLKDLDAATKEKFDAMISAGIFDGVDEGKFGLKDEMNRAQFAKVASLIFGLKVDTTLKTSSFKDVKADDPANGYALPYIEAVRAAGITDGYAEGEYNPAGKVTKEQLATFLIRGLGKDADAKATAGVADATVSDWAKGYVALAINLKLLANGADGKFSGTSNATRDLLVLSSYEAKQQHKLDFNGQYAIASLKATDADKLTLELNGALTEEAAKALTIEVKKDGAVVSNYTTTWDEKKTVATLKFDSKFQNNKYDVTIGGVSNLDSTAKTASVTTTVEKITKIDFLTASETIPLAWDEDENPQMLHKVRVDFKATNQYGAQSSLTSSAFDIKVSGDSTTSPIAGQQAFYLLQDDVDTNDRINISILHEESGAQVTRTFVVGMESQVAKIELADLLDSSGNKLDAIDGEGGYGYLDFKAYDQYGFRVDDVDVLNDSVSVYTNDGDLDTGTDTNDDPFVDSVIGDDAAELRLWSSTAEQKEVTVTVSAGGSGQSVSKAIKISATKEPATVEFGNYSYTLAEGDNIDRLQEDEFTNMLYVPIIVKDAKGEQLTQDEIVDAFDDQKFDFDTSSGIDLVEGEEIKRTGKYKGYVAIANVDNTGSQEITVTLEDVNNASATWRTSVASVRTVETAKFSTTPKKYMTRGATNDFKVKFYDQYGQPVKYENDEDYQYRAELTFRYTGSGAAPGGLTLVNRATGSVLNATYAPQVMSLEDLYDKKFEFVTENIDLANAPYELKVELFRQEAGESEWNSINSLTTTMEVLDIRDNSNSFTYEAYLDKTVDNNTILAAGEYFDAPGSSVQQATYLLVDNKLTKLGKEVKVRVKHNGEEVKTAAQVSNVSSTNQNVAYALDVDNSAKNKFIVAGIDAGTTNLQVVYTNLKNERNTAGIPVTTKNEAPSVKSIDLKRSENTFSRATIANGVTLDDLAEKVTIKDQYGNEIVSEKGTNDQFVESHDQALNLTYYISDIEGGTQENFDQAALNDGVIKLVNGGSVTSFTVNILAPSGVAGSFSVNLQ